MLYQSVQQLHHDLQGVIESSDGRVQKVVDASRLRAQGIDSLIYTAVFADTDELRAQARTTIRECALQLGIRPSSIQTLYEAMGRGEASGFTVPAMNFRALAYDSARAAFRAAHRLGVGPMIFEIARSEIGYTLMRPAEYAANILAAAIKEGHEGPVFIQGDHFQVNASKYQADAATEMKALRDVTKEAVDAQFLNIDVDSSTLVDLSRPNAKEQQRPNFEVAADMIRFIRGIQPAGVDVSVGVEIGEVGKKNSTPEELRAFMDGLHETLAGSFKGPSKISVQTGSSHGGVVLPDGTIAKVAIAFETLEEMSRVARQEYGMAGAVQHGASTLPDELFHRFVEVGTAEIHLATNFQSMIYDSPLFPESLRQEVYAYLKEKHADEWKAGQTEAQFLYSARKRGTGPFKRQMWDLPEEIRGALRQELEERFAFLFEQLRVPSTLDLLARYVPA
ncbi:MAG: class II fructose-bisphosphate aldolase [Dehalococcoidia bacterium]|nr:class II fructose-bisphosphate aldolase [Dehalococcoidia bacterium]